MIREIDHREIPGHWDSVELLIHKALCETKGEQSVKDVRKALLTRKAKLWVYDQIGMGITAIFVTEIISYPQKVSLNIWLTAGEHAHVWADAFLSLMKEYARDINADFIEWTGRPGWQRFLKTKGVEVQSVRMVLGV